MVDTESGKHIQLINRKSLRTLTAQLLVLLMSWDGTSLLSVEQLKQHYETVHSTSLNPCEYGFMTLTELLKSLPYLVEVCKLLPFWYVWKAILSRDCESVCSNSFSFFVFLLGFYQWCSRRICQAYKSVCFCKECEVLTSHLPLSANFSSWVPSSIQQIHRRSAAA